MDERGIDDIPHALVIEQVAIEAAYDAIKHLPPGHPEIAAYAERLKAHDG